MSSDIKPEKFGGSAGATLGRRKPSPIWTRVDVLRYGPADRWRRLEASELTVNEDSRPPEDLLNRVTTHLSAILAERIQVPRSKFEVRELSDGTLSVEPGPQTCFTSDGHWYCCDDRAIVLAIQQANLSVLLECAVLKHPTN